MTFVTAIKAVEETGAFASAPQAGCLMTLKERHNVGR